ncbi:hypothetical protein Tco_0995490 [Tanacetum coccineum]
MRSDNRFADAFARYDSGGASGSGGSRVRDSEGGEDGDDTRGEDGGDETSLVMIICSLVCCGECIQVLVDFFRKKSGNAAVQAVYIKKIADFSPATFRWGKISPAKGQNSRSEKRLKSPNSKGIFPSVTKSQGKMCN